MALPTAEALQKAPFMACVKHSETILQEFTTSSNPQHLDLLSALVRTSNGARGLYVTLLANESITLADKPLGDDVLTVLSGANIEEEQRAVLRDILAKNVVMPRCMVVAHGRNPDGAELKQASELTANRSARVAKAVLTVDEGFRVVLHEMLDGMARLQGRYEPFVRRRNYDEEQREAAVSALSGVLGEQAN